MDFVGSFWFYGIGDISQSTVYHLSLGNQNPAAQTLPKREEGRCSTPRGLNRSPQLPWHVQATEHPPDPCECLHYTEQLHC